MRTDPDILQTKISSYEQQVLDQKFELARLKKYLDLQELKLSLLHEICRISTGTFEIGSLLDSYNDHEGHQGGCRFPPLDRPGYRALLHQGNQGGGGGDGEDGQSLIRQGNCIVRGEERIALFCHRP